MFGWAIQKVLQIKSDGLSFAGRLSFTSLLSDHITILNQENNAHLEE